MKDYSMLFSDMYGGDLVPKKNEFERSVVRPSVVDTIIDHLRGYRICIISGYPRTGKTNIAFCVAHEALSGKVDFIDRVRYLDLANIVDRDSKQTFFTERYFTDKRLLIVDNWHARPSIREKLDRIIDDQWEKGGRILYCITRYEAVDANRDLPVLNRARLPHYPIVNAEEFRDEVARGMIDHRRDSFTGVDVEEADYDQALSFPTEHKFVRNNLRVLRWRLQAWNPKEIRLREVSFDNVIKTFRDDQRRMITKYPGTIDRIAAVAQWEIPFLRAPGMNLEGIEDLKRAGLIIPVVPNNSWRMDSTDAYMYLVSNNRNEWLHISKRLLFEYLNERPTQVLSFVETISAQAEWSIKTVLIVDLLSDEELLGRIVRSIKEGVQNGELNDRKFYRMIYPLLRDFPKEEDVAEARLKILNLLTTDELGRLLGESSGGTGLYVLSWMMILFKKNVELFRSFIRNYINGYGLEVLTGRIDAIKSTENKKNFLKLLKLYVPDLAREVEDSVEFMPSIDGYTHWLFKGLVQPGEYRQSRIDSLGTVDESFLIELTEQTDKSKAYILQMFMQAAMWFSPVEAERIASFVPNILTRFETKGKAKEWSFLLNNVYTVNALAAAEIVDYICTMRAGKFFSDDPNAFSRMLVAMEKVQPGCVGDWIKKDEDGLISRFGRKGRKKNDDLVPLSLFAKESLVRILAGYSPEQIAEIIGSGGAFERHVAIGALELCGVPAELIPGEEIAFELPDRKLGTIQFLSGLFSMNMRSRTEQGNSQYRRLCDCPDQLPPSVIIAMARLERCWDARRVTDSMRSLLRGRRSQRDKGLERVIMATIFLGSIKWPKKIKPDSKQEGHRQIESALFEGILDSVVRRDSAEVDMRVNRDHPLVQTTFKKTRCILDGLSEDDVISVNEWDARIRGAVSIPEADPIRAQLIYWGVVEPVMEISIDTCDVGFRQRDVDAKWINSTLDLLVR